MAKRILVVDDEPDIRRLLEGVLCRDGYRVETACDGREALGVLRRVPVDVVISDVSMPDFDGFQLCAALHLDSRFQRIPVILFTAFTHDKALVPLRRLDKVTIVAKGEPLQVLRETVRAAVNGPRRQTVAVTA